jgi:hypothetical protein
LVIYQAKGLEYALVALDKQSGALRWVSQPNVFSSTADANSLIVRIGCRDVLVTGIGTVLDPKTGVVLGEAIPHKEKDSKRYSQLFGAPGQVSDMSPAIGMGTDGLLGFGDTFEHRTAQDPWSEVQPPAATGRWSHFLVVRLILDANGKITTSSVFPDRIPVPFVYGGIHGTIVKNRLVTMPGYSNTFSVFDLAAGKVIITNRAAWSQGKAKDIKPDPNAPDIRAALDEFGLTINSVIEFNRGIGRNGYSSYSRTFVDGRGCIWYMNRQAQFYRIDPDKEFAAELAGTLVHPECWTSNSSPVPHGNRIYVRTFGRLACIGEK